jgi:hypothetical protein
MRIFLATLVTALLWISLMPVDAQTIYPTQRCVYTTLNLSKFRVSANDHAFYPQTVCANVKAACVTITRIVADIDLPQVSFLA